MNLNKLKNKKICFLGWGLENQALVGFLLKKKVNCEITICDRKIIKGVRHPIGCRTPQAIIWRLGSSYDKNLDKYDIIFRSPGYPLFASEIQKITGLPRSGRARARNDIVVSSPMKLFFELCPTKNIIGITGTKGKGTTASLIASILKADGKRVFLGGNIGIAPFEFIERIKKDDWVVLELSSFQLEDIEVSPRIAVMTNFTREHLAPADPNNPNFHRSITDYWKAKNNIFRWQKKNDYAVISEKLDIGNWKLGKGKKIFFTKSELLSQLVGEHNKENVAAAVAVAKIVGVKNKIIKKAVAGFKGLEHRLEHVKTINQIKYYNDSFATTPESTIIALKSFSAPTILLLGGADKKSNFKQLAKEVKKRAKFVILLNGKATPRIKKELLKAGYPKDKIKLVYNIKDAVKIAKRNFTAGDIVLLSPACASFGMFKNYKERGGLFKDNINSYAK